MPTLNYLTDVKPFEATLNDTQIAARKNAGDDGWVEIGSPSVTQWLGENGLREKIDIFLAKPLPPEEHPQYGDLVFLRAGLKQTLEAQKNAAATLIIKPSHPNYALLMGAMQVGVVDATDVENLKTRARPGWVDVTAEDVSASRAAHLAANAATATQHRIYAAQSAATVANEQGKTDAEILAAMVDGFGEVKA